MALAVLGSERRADDGDAPPEPAAARCEDADVPADAEDPGAAADVALAADPPPAAAAPLRASVAFTCFSVTARGGLVVMIVALSWSPEWKSETWAGFPSRTILIPRLSISPCVNDLKP